MKKQVYEEQLMRMRNTRKYEKMTLMLMFRSAEVMESNKGNDNFNT